MKNNHSVLEPNKKLYFVEKTRIYVSYAIPVAGQEAYTTRNAAIRAVSRYRRENLAYMYCFPGACIKNVRKFLANAIEIAFAEETGIHVYTPTVKIEKFHVNGLPDYKRS